jgi:hypothetical protein
MNGVKTHLWWARRAARGIVVIAWAAWCLGEAQLAAADDATVTLDGPTGPDAKRLFALGMIESGNDDRGIGPGGEVSRYQIQPAVWKMYSGSRDYQVHELSRSVASLHWNYLATYFRERTGREPTDFDMYILWNTRMGYYAGKGFDQQLVSPVVRDRARRFVNLVNR